MVGYQWALPFSKKLGSRFATNANLGVTYFPGVRQRLGGSTGPLSPRHSLVTYNLGASEIFALLPRFHLMLEWIGVFQESINDAGKASAGIPADDLAGLSDGSGERGETCRSLLVLGRRSALIATRAIIGALLYLSIEHNFY